MENSGKEVLQKVKNKTIIWPSNSTTGYLSKGRYFWCLSQKDTEPCIHCNIIYNSQNMEAICVHQWLNGYRKCIYTHTHTLEYYSAIKRNSAICDNMNEPGMHNAKWNKLRERQIGRKKKSQTHRKRDHMCVYQRWRVEGWWIVGKCSQGTNFQF